MARAMQRHCARRPAMPESKKPYIVVVATDYSASGELALDRALELTGERPQAELHVLHVLPFGLPALAPELEFRSTRGIPAIDEAAQELAKHVEKKLLSFRATPRGRAAPESMRVVPHLRLDTPAFEIAQLATDLEADLVVVGTHGRRAL